MSFKLAVYTADELPSVDPAVWTNQSSRVRSPDEGGSLFTSNRGRASESELISASTATVYLDNTDRAFDPRSSTTRTWWHVRAVLEREGMSDVALFRGFLERIIQHHASHSDRYAEFKLVDAMKWLSSVDVDLERPQELSGLRIKAVLDYLGWPAALMNIPDGLVEVSAREELEVAMDWITDAVEAEDGVFYVDPSGLLTFEDRHSRLDLEQTNIISVTEPSEYTGVWDDETLVNVARTESAEADRQGAGRISIFKDQASIDLYGEHLFRADDLSIVFAEQEALGMWAVLRYAGAHERLEPVEFVAAAFDSPLLAISIGSRMNFQRVWPDDHVDNLDVIVEGITLTLAASSAQLTWRLSPWWGDRDWLIVADTDVDDVPGLDEGVAAP